MCYTSRVENYVSVHTNTKQLLLSHRTSTCYTMNLNRRARFLYVRKYIYINSVLVKIIIMYICM